MLFNSYGFLLIFLPAALALHVATERFAPKWRLHVLLILSAGFYSYWDFRVTPLLLASIILNWIAAQLFYRLRVGLIVALAILINLAVLGVFKYYNFFIDLIPGQPIRQADIVLPLGISFFTFHHIMYLTDLWKGVAPRFDLVRYGLYIAFFPQVLSGPLVRWSEIMHQFDERPYQRPDAAERCARGVLLLIVGLAKKALLGDAFGTSVNQIYATVKAGQTISVLDAWQAALGFSFQIYFDFSGYTDMALGVALLFGIVLPQNFNAPYRATSLQDFWRRWHMTLSRFLRDYLYIPLGGSRHGLAVQISALLATMGLGGLWHGAGFTFIIWGLAHGLGLTAGVLWRRAGLSMPVALSWLLTFLFVVMTWVLFRAPTLDAARTVYGAMLGAAPLGSSFDWPLMLTGAIVALVGPTSWDFAWRVPPARWAAYGSAAAFVAVLLIIGRGANLEFIYFQF
jgi:D-alanyl-lipoteichoic acid acyltransferase DltB (MBOAT superfamily)